MDSVAVSKATALVREPDHEEVRAAPRPSVVEGGDGPLYANRVKVYPKAVKGRYRRIKWAVLVACLTLYYLAPWLRWDRGPGAPDQALLIDMTNARAYFLWLEIWPQEVYYLTGLLVLGAIGLFLVTSLLGRVWCGYACPQTVWTDLFMLVERLVEGDRNARIRLDRARWSAGKAARKALKHGIWLLIAGATGGAWILYFNDAPTTFRTFFVGQASMAIYFFFGLFTTTTYVLAGIAREQVCTYMCPWPRFQAAMLDEHTLTVSYQAWRGEKRGHAPQDGNWTGRGDCIDCRACIAVCPTGIDIRDGSQLECIGCGLCIDACNEIMPRVGRPPNLIDFATLTRQSALAAGRTPEAYRLLRPRTLIYAALLLLTSGIMAFGLGTRAPATLTVQADRTPLFVRLSDGDVRDGYTIKIANRTHERADYDLSVETLKSARLTLAGATESRPVLRLSVNPDSVGTFQVYVRSPPLASERVEFNFILAQAAGAVIARHDAHFTGPGHDHHSD